MLWKPSLNREGDPRYREYVPPKEKGSMNFSIEKMIFYRMSTAVECIRLLQQQL